MRTDSLAAYGDVADLLLCIVLYLFFVGFADVVGIALGGAFHIACIPYPIVEAHLFAVFAVFEDGGFVCRGIDDPIAVTVGHVAHRIIEVASIARRLEGMGFTRIVAVAAYTRLEGDISRSHNVRRNVYRSTELFISTVFGT